MDTSLTAFSIVKFNNLYDNFRYLKNLSNSLPVFKDSITNSFTDLFDSKFGPKLNASHISLLLTCISRKLLNNQIKVQEHVAKVLLN